MASTCCNWATSSSLSNDIVALLTLVGPSKLSSTLKINRFHSKPLVSVYHQIIAILAPLRREKNVIWPHLQQIWSTFEDASTCQPLGQHDSYNL